MESDRANYQNTLKAYRFAEFLLGQFARTITVFFRHDFGQRYFTIADILGSTFTFLLIFSFIAVLYQENENNARNAANRALAIAQSRLVQVLILFLLSFLAMSILHQIFAFQARKRRIYWHSRYAGTSYISEFMPAAFHDAIEQLISRPFDISERYFVQRFVEPFIAFSAGSFLFFAINQPLGLWISLAAIALAALEWLQYARGRNKILDSIDAQIEARNLADAISGKNQITASETSGFVLPVRPSMQIGQQKALFEGMTKLDPALEAILDAPPVIGDNHHAAREGARF